MKRYRNAKVALVLLLLVSLLFSASAIAAPVIRINGHPLDAAPVTEQGTTLVPLRSIFQALGAQVNWDQGTQTIIATKDSTTIKLAIGQKTAYRNGQAVSLAVPAKVVKGNTLVPLRFVGEALGAQVNWDQGTQTITITSNDSALQAPVVRPQINGTQAKVTRVVDGDTIVVTIDGREEKVRLIGVDTPETVHPSKPVEAYGKEASDYTKSRLDGQEVMLEFDVQERDQYGRLLAYVWIGSELFNETLVHEGYARVATFPPNVKYVERFTNAQKTAREANKGLWGLEDTSIQPQPATSGKYVGSTQSDKYHVPACRWAEKILESNRIWFQSREEAEAASYKPCGVCKP